MSDITNLNIVTLGRARMGKSSLLNYLVGKDRFKAAPGNTVTSEGFYYEKSKIDGINVTFIDSYGIESGSNFKKWEKLLDKKLKEHDLSDDMNEWLHIVIYCLSGEDKGVQPIDTEIINKFSQSGTRVIIAITHSDCCSEQDGRIMKDVVLASCHSVREQDFVEICSVNRTERGAEEYSGGGLEEYDYSAMQ